MLLIMSGLAVCLRRELVFHSLRQNLSGLNQTSTQSCQSSIRTTLVTSHGFCSVTARGASCSVPHGTFHCSDSLQVQSVEALITPFDRSNETEALLMN